MTILTLNGRRNHTGSIMKIALNSAIVVLSLLYAPLVMANDDTTGAVGGEIETPPSPPNPFQAVLQSQQQPPRGLNSWTQPTTAAPAPAEPVQAPLIGPSGSTPPPVINPASKGMLNRYMGQQPATTTQQPAKPKPAAPAAASPELPVTPLNIPNTATVGTSDDVPFYVKLDKPKRAWGGTD